MKKNYIALVRYEKENRQFIESKDHEDEEFSYKNMNQFYSDLKANGYKVIYICTEEKAQHIKDTDFFELLKEFKWSQSIDTICELFKQIWREK